MNVTLSLTSDELGEESLHGLCRDLCLSLSRETEVQAKLAEGPAISGVRGEPITLGVILVTFLASPVAAAMFNVLKAFFERDASLEVELQREDGETLKIGAQNLGSNQLQQSITLAQEFLRGA
jgi:hypothetical protein